MIKEINLSSKSEFDMIDINKQVTEAVKESGVNEGICTVYVPHATAAVIINENADPNIAKDFLDATDKIVPLHAGYLHDKIDNNAAAHIKAAIIGPSETIPILNGNLGLGTWQDINVVEFDGPKTRRVIITIFPNCL